MQIPEQAIWLYRHLTSGNRRQLLEQLSAENRLPIAILFYHRVAKVNCDNPWSITQDNFRRHLDWLQDNFDLISLSEAQRRIRGAKNSKFSVAITFDDGYADNAKYAIPELVQRQIPTTYFVSTNYVTTGSPFPHDVALGAPLPSNTIDQLREFARQGVEIGAHTRSHTDIGTITEPAKLYDELVGSIEVLREWFGEVSPYFAFPYGLPKNMSQASVDLLRQSGFEGFCSGYGALNWPGSDGFHLRRIHADPGIERLKNWLTLDSRKLHDSTALPFVELSHANAAFVTF